MRGACIVARRELAAWLDAPGNWLVAGLYLLALQALFWFLGYPIGQQRWPGLWEGRVASVQAMYAWLPLSFVLLVPALCMSSWAEERRSGTDELLLSFPLRARQCVLGKFLASWSLLALLVVAAVVPLALVVARLGDLDPGACVCGLAGAILLAGSCAAIAQCLSAVSSEPLAAFLLGAIALGALWSTSLYARLLPAGAAELVVSLSPYAHYVDTAAHGLLDLRDLVYHALWIGAALALNTVLVQGRRWR